MRRGDLEIYQAAVELARSGETRGWKSIQKKLVEANHGNITLMARSIVQNGALQASTALNNRDGSIRLQAWGEGMRSYYSPSTLQYWSTGSLLLGSGSARAILIEESATSIHARTGKVCSISAQDESRCRDPKDS
ncbi:hypothetical protein V1282_005772 [Nitrobacteraceae bacterium AZCC 2146]